MDIENEAALVEQLKGKLCTSLKWHKLTAKQGEHQSILFPLKMQTCQLNCSEIQQVPCHYTDTILSS